jgi:hypothetical protein
LQQAYLWLADEMVFPLIHFESRKRFDERETSNFIIHKTLRSTNGLRLSFYESTPDNLKNYASAEYSFNRDWHCSRLC